MVMRMMSTSTMRLTRTTFRPKNTRRNRFQLVMGGGPIGAWSSGRGTSSAGGSPRTSSGPSNGGRGSGGNGTPSPEGKSLSKTSAVVITP